MTLPTAAQLGFITKAVKGKQEAFFFEFSLPAIAHVIVDGTLLHYVVIHKITKKLLLLRLFSVVLSMLRTQLLVYLSQKLDIALLLGYIGGGLGLLSAS